MIATAGGVVSIFTVAELVEPVPAPLLPELSVAVQLTELVPSVETAIGALAVGVPEPVIVPTRAPVQLIPAMLQPPFDVSSAVTVPVAWLVHHGLLPVGVP